MPVRRLSMPRFEVFGMMKSIGYIFLVFSISLVASKIYLRQNVEGDNAAEKEIQLRLWKLWGGGALEWPVHAAI